MLAALMFITIAACGAAPEPVKVASLPIFAGSKPATDAAHLAVVDAMLTEMKKTPNLNVASVEHAAYSVPIDVKWEAVKAFYDPELVKGGFTTDAKLAFAQGPVSGQGWIRGKQMVFIYLVSEPALGDGLLVTVLGTQN